MIVNRRTIVVKPGCMDRVLALLRDEARKFPHPHPRRMYTPSIAPFDTFVLDVVFESLEDYQKYWTEWGARPETAAFVEEWLAVTETGGTNEIWTVEEA